MSSTKTLKQAMPARWERSDAGPRRTSNCRDVQLHQLSSCGGPMTVHLWRRILLFKSSSSGHLPFSPSSHHAFTVPFQRRRPAFRLQNPTLPDIPESHRRLECVIGQGLTGIRSCCGGSWLAWGSIASCRLQPQGN